MNQAEVDGLLAYLLTEGWIDSANKVTERGIAELAAGKRRPRRVEPQQISVTSIPYYPESLR
ncbi:hypothetical protein DC432_14960 [Microbacterium testaceum]|uniref:PRTase associated wHTH domain-containing protein n=2 Tax=Microbacterium testaceum TaxID=2033 RepID=A0A2T7VYZ4_MICTE|nr:hypothetical protein DC432_14960 [Microbacterium testaceum]